MNSKSTYFAENTYILFYYSDVWYTISFHKYTKQHKIYPESSTGLLCIIVQQEN